MMMQSMCDCRRLLRVFLAFVIWLGITSCQLLEFRKYQQARALCYQLATVVMVVVVAVMSQATATATTATTTATSTTLTPRPDSRCSVDNGVLADESWCRGFIICLKGQARPLQCSRDLLFNRDKFTCDFPSRVDCDKRSKYADGTSCYSAMINVTVIIRNEVKEPRFQAQVALRCPRQPLRYILLMAAGKDPRFRYETQSFEGYGDYVSSFNGVRNDVQDILAVWQPHDRIGEVISENVDDYIPENNEAISFQYKSAIPMG